jgi:hypothetical protein
MNLCAPLITSRWWQLRNEWQCHPTRTIFRLAAWLAVSFVVPGAIRASSTALAANILATILSFDVFLALGTAGVVCGLLLPRVAHAIKADADQWVIAAPYRRRWLWLNIADPVIRVALWPVAVLLGITVLGVGMEGARADVSEILFLAGFGTLAGGLLSLILAGKRTTRTDKPYPFSASVHGLGHLSWQPVVKLLDSFDLRRMMLVSIPVLLAAPLGALAVDVAKVLVVWLIGVALVMLVTSVFSVVSDTRHWLPPQLLPGTALAWRVLKHLAITLLLIVAALVFYRNVAR